VAFLQVLASMILCGIDVAGNGLLIAASKYKNLDRVRNSMARTLVLLSIFIWQSTSRGWGLSGIWTGLLLFFGSRAVQSAPYVLRYACRIG